jgi:uncharacterized protein involved in exopolysaccharide biosynthesis
LACHLGDIQPEPAGRVLPRSSTSDPSARSTVLLRLARLLLQATRKSWALVLATTAVAVTGAAVYAMRQPVIYRSTASVLIDPVQLGG